MLKDELTLLVQIANNYMAGVADASFGNKNGLKDAENRITKECQRIKAAWIRLLFGRLKDPALKRYISFQQKITREVADHLHRQLSLPVDNYTANLEAQSILLGCLLELKDFQIQYFNLYIDKNDKIPDAALPNVIARMLNADERVKNAFRDIHMDENLRCCVHDYFNVTIANSKSIITYRDAEYYISLAENLEAALLFEQAPDLTNNVISMLFYSNFNHVDFCKYYEDKIIRKRISVEQQEQISYLQAELLKLKSFQVMTKITYNPKIPPVNTQLETWLNELIKQEKSLIDTEAYTKSEKLELKLTVAQLALLIRLFYEEGVFGMKNITGLLRFFSSHFISKKQEHISYTSMINHYYSNDQFNGYAIKELLLRMIGKVNKLYFPA